MPISLMVYETLYQPIITSVFLKKKVTMFPILFSEYGCDIVYPKSVIMIHSLVYSLGYHEAIILLLLCHQS